MSELRLVVRNWLRQPLLSSLVVLSVALGIGTTVLLFSIVHALLLDPFDFPHANRLVRLYASNPSQGYGRAGMSLGDALDFDERLRGMEELSFFLPRTMALTGEGRPEMVRAGFASANLFSLLDFETSAGRSFMPDELRPDGTAVAVLSHGFAQRRFGSASAALGKLLRLDEQPREVVGVLTPGSGLVTREVDVWIPFVVDRATADRRSHYLPVLARLRPDVRLEDAQRELVAVATQLEDEHPDSNEGWTGLVLSYRESLVGSVRPILWTLFGAVLFVLLICCANLANLLLARARARSSEAAIRSALGASRGRLIRLFLMEGLTLTVLGGVLGVALAWWGAGLLRIHAARLLPLASQIGVEPGVLGFALLLVLVTGLSVGVFPAWRFAKRAPAEELRSGHGQSESREANRFRGSLILLQTSLALVLLVAAGLTLKALVLLQSNDLGFEPRDGAALQVFLTPDGYDSDAARVQFFESLVARIAAGPEVTAVGAGSALPLRSVGRNSLPFRTSQITTEDAQFATFTAILPDYFRALGIPLWTGRLFDATDHADSRPVVIVNEALAQQTWPDERALGQRLRITIRGDEETELEVVGVVGTVVSTDLREAPQPAVYVPFRQFPHTGMVVVMRSPRATSTLRRAEELVYELDPNQPVYDSFLLDHMVREAGQRDRFFVISFGVFGLFGLILVMTGIYGIVLYNAQQREREMGIRIALGATRSELFYEILRGSLVPALLGMALGLGGAALLSRYLESLLYEVDALDPMVFGLGVASLVFALGSAGVSAGLRILARDPVRSLRQ